ncbi:hypothetical protein AK973_2194 [Pseudomonas brassicacearum]|nr:hypothetical protein AK973_2194 [Pseudomonas brassicacearum]
MDTEGLDKGLGFDRLCDLLAINSAELDSVRIEGLDILTNLAFSVRPENSTARGGQEWIDAPLFNAC